MQLWSIQTPGAWEQLQTNGYLRGDGRRAWVEFRQPYRWLMQQMAERIPGYKGLSYPVWAWPVKPDLRRMGYAERGSKQVRIEFIAPDDQILLSDYELWHSVLNGLYLNRNRSRRGKFEARVRRVTGRTDYFYDQLPPQLQREMEASWLQIFDYHSDDPTWEYGWGEQVFQATLPRIELAWVKKVDIFTVR